MQAEEYKKEYENNLDPKRQDLLKFIDAWNSSVRFCKAKPSNLLKGAWFVIENRKSNPDWIAQSAHSLRELHYKTQEVTKKENRLSGIKHSAESYIAADDKRMTKAKLLEDLHYALTGFAHHFQGEKDSKNESTEQLKKLNLISESEVGEFDLEKTYLKLVSSLENVLYDIVPKGIDGHENIDIFINKNIEILKKGEVLDIEFLKSLTVDKDAKNYFFSKIDHVWYNVLKDNDLLALDKLPNEQYNIPEVGYVNRLVESSPESFMDLLKSYEFNKVHVPILVLDNLHRDICYYLSIEFLEEAIKKIKEEDWVYLLRGTYQSSYEYSELIEKLKASGKYNVLLEILDILFTVIKDEDLNQNDIGEGWYSFPDKLFYFENISKSYIFDILISQNNPLKIKTLETALSIFKKVLNIKHKEKIKDTVFERTEPFYLPQLNIFKSEIEKNPFYSRDDIESLIIMIRKLIDLILIEEENNIESIKNIFSLLGELPNTYSSWGIKLYLITRRPDIFSTEIKTEFNKVLININNYYDYTSGVEYHQSLLDVFEKLDSEYQGDYINKVIENFGKSENDQYYKKEGVKILTLVKDFISDEKKDDIKKVFAVDLESMDLKEPTPRSSHAEGGIITDVSPIEELGKYSVMKIINNLKSIWSPEKIDAEYKNKSSFLNPVNASGLAKEIQEDIKSSDNRLNEYLDHVNFFVDPTISQIYTYYIYSSLVDLRRNGKKFSVDQFKKILSSIVKISQEVKENDGSYEFKNKSFDLGNWYWVLNSISSLIESTMYDLNDDDYKDFRQDLITVISYLLKIEGSPDKDSEDHICDPTTGNDPHGEAINSVRGKAYTAFIALCCKDGKLLMDDTKKVFKDFIVSEKSTAVRFLIGYNLVYLYTRDRDFILELKDSVFKDENFGSVEGYLSSNLHPKMFIDFKEVYKNILSLDEKSFSVRTYTKNLDEGLAEHLALAYLYFEDTKEKEELLDVFWKTKNSKQQKHFINFIGRTVINSENALTAINNNLLPKLKSLIDLVLGLDLDNKVYSGFGFWVNKDKEILDDVYLIDKLAIILNRSNGELDWDYGFIQRLKVFSEKDPKNTLLAINNYFIDSAGNLSAHRLFPIYVSEEKEALEIINESKDCKEQVRELIDRLLILGGNNFWQLKDITKK